MLAKRTHTLSALPPYAADTVAGLVAETRALDRLIGQLVAISTTTSPAPADDDNDQQPSQPSQPSQSFDAPKAAALLVPALALRRNKRALLAYHRLRAERLAAIAWEGRELDAGAVPTASASVAGVDNTPGAGTSGVVGSAAARGAEAAAVATSAAVAAATARTGTGTGTGAGVSAGTAGGAEFQTGGATASTSRANLSPDEAAFFSSYAAFLLAAKAPWTDIDLAGDLAPPREVFVDVRVTANLPELPGSQPDERGRKRRGLQVETEYGSIRLTPNSQFFVRLGDVERLIAMGYLQRLD